MSVDSFTHRCYTSQSNICFIHPFNNASCLLFPLRSLNHSVDGDRIAIDHVLAYRVAEFTSNDIMKKEIKPYSAERVIFDLIVKLQKQQACL